MKVAITNPTAWPYVRRGAERFANDLAGYLARRGHQVTIISTGPGKRQVTRQRGYTTIYHRNLWHPQLASVGIRQHHTFFLPALVALTRRKYDVVVCCQYIDAYAGRLARAITGTPYVFAFLGIPPQVRSYRTLTAGGAVMRRAVERADALLVSSRYVEDYVGRRWGTSCLRIPLPLSDEMHSGALSRPGGRPVVLCTAALDEARKGGALLMRAFNALKGRRREPLLQIAYPLSAACQRDLLALVAPEWRADVEFRTDAVDLPALYRAAAISVLPSLWEAYGLVVLESMAAGTPVVGARSGALPELIASPDIGRLFEPGDLCSPEATNVDGLARALEECLDLSLRPETAERCRTRAADYTWSKLGPEFEAVLRRVCSAGAATTA